ncbi:MAG: aminotransferase class IV [Bacteroidota bacterium]
MCRFIETLQLKEGKLLNLDYHQSRVNRTFSAFFPESTPFLLHRVLTEKDLPDSGKFKCTLHYAKKPIDFFVNAYVPRNIKKLRIQMVNKLDYSWKYADRSVFSRLVKDLHDDEEIIIIKEGFVTDASYANLAFFDGITWVTPSHPLLFGTKRQKLLSEGKIIEKAIRTDDIRKYRKCSLINAMLDLGELEVNVKMIK